MISLRSCVIFSWRQHLSGLLFIEPFEWSLENQALSLSYGWKYWLWTINPVYLVLYDSYILFNVISYLWTWNDTVDFDKVQFIADIFFVNMMTLFLIGQSIVRLEIVQLTNHILQLDEHLEDTMDLTRVHRFLWFVCKALDFLQICTLLQF